MYKYKYRVFFWLANGNTSRDILEQYSTFFEKAIEEFNLVSREGKAKNPKRIIDFSFKNEGTIIELALESSVELSRPTIALQTFSRHLVKNTPLAELVSGNQLFRGSSEEIINESTPLSDKDMLKVIIDVVMENKGKEDKRRDLLDDIKSLIEKYEVTERRL